MLIQPGYGEDARVMEPLPTARYAAPAIRAAPTPPVSPRKTDARWTFPPAVHRTADLQHGLEPPGEWLIGGWSDQLTGRRTQTDRQTHTFLPAVHRMVDIQHGLEPPGAGVVDR